jgi:hypothetical protein
LDDDTDREGFGHDSRSDSASRDGYAAAQGFSGRGDAGTGLDAVDAATNGDDDVTTDATEPTSLSADEATLRDEQNRDET